ncbi:MAG: glycosyltransferase [Bacteroidales bacterium]|nr:glycosyltransferase [Bacteroidales bacterium]
MQKIKILHNVHYLGKTSFGLGQISVSLASAQYSLGHDVRIWCLENEENIMWASSTHDFPADRINGFKLFGPRNLLYSTDLIRQAKNDDTLFDIVHQHGIWTGISKSTLLLAKNKKIPTIIAPHGSLNQWALDQSRWKKQIARAFYENQNLKLASCLHATSENEISDFRNFGLRNPIAYLENGIHEKHLTSTGNSDRFRERYSIAKDKRILFFLSRISPKKGLTMLVEAINSIQEDFAPWQLIIAGVDEFNHKKEIELLVKQLNLESKIKILGPLFGQEKDDALAASELFILPSYSEGSPMVILDSLAAGVPVITTKASTWNDLNQHNCGWWTEINTDAITGALHEALNMSTEELKQMGKNGKELILSKYTWPQLAQKTLQLYNWLLGHEEKPDFVILD